MAGRTENSTDSVSFTVTVSEQSNSLLEQLAQDGVYGKSRAEVAARFIDQVLREDHVVPARFKLVPARKGNKRSPVRIEVKEGEFATGNRKKTVRKS